MGGDEQLERQALAVVDGADADADALEARLAADPEAAARHVELLLLEAALRGERTGLDLGPAIGARLRGLDDDRLATAVLQRIRRLQGEQGRTVLELRVFAGPDLLDVVLHGAQRDLTLSHRRRRADVFASAQGLPADPFPLVRCGQDGRRWLTFFAHWDGEVDLGAGPLSLASAIDAGLAHPVSALPGCHELELTRRARAVVHHGGLALALRLVDAPRPLGVIAAAPRLPEPAFLGPAVTSLALHLAAVLTFALYPFEARSLRQDLFTQPDRFARLILAPPGDDVTVAARLAEIQAKVRVPRVEVPPRIGQQSRPGARRAPPERGGLAFDVEALVAGGGALGGGSLAGALRGVIGTLGAGAGSGLAGLGMRGGGPLLGGSELGSRSVGLSELGASVLRAAPFGAPGAMDAREGGHVAVASSLWAQGLAMDSAQLPAVRGGLEAEQVRAVIARHRNQLRHCFTLALRGPERPAGPLRLRLHWVLGPDGAVLRAVVRDRFHDAGGAPAGLDLAALEACLLDRIRGWRFPRPTGGGEVEVLYPLVFSLARPAAE